MIKAVGIIIIIDAVISLWPTVPNNHDNYWLELGRWVRFMIGVTLVFY